MKSEIRTAVFPVAGRGTRFLPATKASPKEMLPVVDKPLIQFAVEEALAAGAQPPGVITGASQRAIEGHFYFDQELEKMLESQGKTALARPIRRVLPRYATCIYIRQSAPLGLGHAVLCAEAAVGQEPFFVHLADDLIDAEVPCLKQMAATYAFHRGSVLGVEEIPRRDTDKYGIVEVETARIPVSRIRSIVEKPKPKVAPSTLAVVGRYVLTPGVFDQLRQLGPGPGGGSLVPARVVPLLAREAVYAHRFEGKRYDCGSKLGYLQATVEHALAHPELSRAFRSYLIRLAHGLEGDRNPKPKAGGAKRSGRRARSRARPRR